MTPTQQVFVLFYAIFWGNSRERAAEMEGLPLAAAFQMCPRQLAIVAVTSRTQRDLFRVADSFRGAGSDDGAPAGGEAASLIS